MDRYRIKLLYRKWLLWLRRVNRNHSHPTICGHSPVDMADSVVRGAVDSTDKALSIQASTEALNELIEKVEKRTIDRCCVELKRLDYWYSAAAIIRLPTGQIKLEELL